MATDEKKLAELILPSIPAYKVKKSEEIKIQILKAEHFERLEQALVLDADSTQYRMA